VKNAEKTSATVFHKISFFSAKKMMKIKKKSGGLSPPHDFLLFA